MPKFLPYRSTYTFWKGCFVVQSILLGIYVFRHRKWYSYRKSITWHVRSKSFSGNPPIPKKTAPKHGRLHGTVICFFFKLAFIGQRSKHLHMMSITGFSDHRLVIELWITHSHEYIYIFVCLCVFYLLTIFLFHCNCWNCILYYFQSTCQPPRDAQICRMYGFYDECKRKCNVKLWKYLCNLKFLRLGPPVTHPGSQWINTNVHY